MEAPGLPKNVMDTNRTEIVLSLVAASLGFLYRVYDRWLSHEERTSGGGRKPRPRR